MHKNTFPIFITSLGLFAVYVFYVLMHTNEMNPSQANNQSINTEITNKEYTKSIASKGATIKTLPFIVSSHNKIANKEEPNVSSLVYETPEEIEETYEALIPESYDNTVLEAESAFSLLDVAVLEMQERIDTPTVEIEQTE